MSLPHLIGRRTAFLNLHVSAQWAPCMNVTTAEMKAKNNPL